MNLFSIVLLAVAALPPRADSITMSSLKQGDRLRVESSVFDGKCVLARAMDDSLILRRPGGDAIERLALSDLDRLEVSLGDRSRSMGARRGFMIGLLGGAAAGVVTGIVFAVNGNGSDFDIEPGTVMSIMGIGGSLVGGIVGAAIGAILPGEAWQRIDFSIAVP
jgi:hypothetical protein